MMEIMQASRRGENHGHPIVPASRKAATQADVAREVGVSRTLVSFAFRDAPGVSEETKRAIMEAAARLDYRPNTVAARLATKHPDSVGLYLLDLRNEVYTDVFDGLRETLHDHTNQLVLSVSKSASDTDPDAINTLMNARVGVIVAATFTESDEAVQRLSARVPVVSAVRFVPGVDSVYPDDEHGGRIATEHLISLGHRRILHLAGPPNDGLTGRRAGFEAQMRDSGLRPETITMSDYSRFAAREAIMPILQRQSPPTAIITHNDEAALGVREAAFQCGHRIPEDISLIGFDDTRASSIAGVDLTTINLHAHEMGRQAGELALRRLQAPDRPAEAIKLTPSLVIRRTTAPLAST